MSVLCLICKNKLLADAPGSPVICLNSIVPSEVVATCCGHLYHADCLQCWFAAEKKKVQDLCTLENLADYCPTCRTEVNFGELRRIHLLEDEEDSLEKAKLVQKSENLEIKCRQLEFTVKELRRENSKHLSLDLSKPLTSTSTLLRSEKPDGVQEGDRVMWLKWDSLPLPGVILSIFRKDESLWVKIKLDRKLRKNPRSGLFGSFRSGKRHEYIVPLGDVMLETDFIKNNVIDENKATTEPTTPTIFLPLLRFPGFRNSTLSLPGDVSDQFRV